MSNEFDELPSGSGEAPTKDQVLSIYNHIRARKGGKDPGTKAVLDEVIACGFASSRSTVGRFLEGAPGRNAPPEKAKEKQRKRNTLDTAEKRVQRKRLNARHSHKPRPNGDAYAKGNVQKPAMPSVGEVAAKLVDGLVGEAEIAKMSDLLAVNEQGVEKYTAAQLAIRENRARMALNIIIAERMASKSELLLLDMRGTAALVDALTVASKLSGGAAIDVKPPGMMAGEVSAPINGISPNGHPMKELNERPIGLAADLVQFRRERAVNGTRA